MRTWRDTRMFVPALPALEALVGLAAAAARVSPPPQYPGYARSEPPPAYSEPPSYHEPVLKVSLLMLFLILLLWIPHVCFMWHGPRACAKRTGAATSVARRRRERLALLGRGVQASQSNTRMASQTFENTYMQVNVGEKA